MLRDALHHRRREAARAFERRQPEIDMILDDLELRRRQRAGLGQQRARHLGLADIGQHADQPEFGQLCLGNTQVSPECDQIKRDLDAMVISVDVLIAQPGDEHHGVRVGDHGVDDIVDAGPHRRNIREIACLDGSGEFTRNAFALGEGLSGPRQLDLNWSGDLVDRQRRTFRQDAGHIQLTVHLRGRSGVI